MPSAVSLIAAAITLAVQQAGGQMSHGDALPLSLRLANAVDAIAIYFRQTFWPSGLAAYYPHPLDRLPLWRVATSAAFLLAISALAIGYARRRPYLIVGWLWFLGTLVPVLGLIQVSLQAHADRYVYIPLTGLSIAVTWGAVDLFGRSRAGRAALVLAAVAACLAMGIVSYHQVGYWRDSRSLFERAAAVTGDNYFAQNGIATVYYEQGQLDLAREHYREAIRLEPRWPLPHLGLAQVFIAAGQRLRAIETYRTLLETNPSYPIAHERLAVQLALEERFAEATDHFLRAVSLGLDTAEVHARLGTSAARSGQTELARKHLDLALLRRPGWSSVASERSRLPE